MLSKNPYYHQPVCILVDVCNTANGRIWNKELVLQYQGVLHNCEVYYAFTYLHTVLNKYYSFVVK